LSFIRFPPFSLPPFPPFLLPAFLPPRFPPFPEKLLPLLAKIFSTGGCIDASIPFPIGCIDVSIPFPIAAYPRFPVKPFIFFCLQSSFMLILKFSAFDPFPIDRQKKEEKKAGLVHSYTVI